MEVTTKMNGQALSVEAGIEAYECIERTDHKEKDLAHEKRRHWDIREFDGYTAATEGRLPHVQVIWDETANTGQVPQQFILHPKMR